MKLIPLTKGLFAKVDDSDFIWLSKWKWFAIKSGNTFYAVRSDYSTAKQIRVWMHREIIGEVKKGLFVDHEDQDGLNNKKENLRFATRSQNKMNATKKKITSSMFKGVTWRKGRNKWQSFIIENGKKRCLGHFKNEKDAATAYNEAAIITYKEFASLNNIPCGN